MNQISQVRICPNCRLKILDDTGKLRVCPRCGAILRAAKVVVGEGSVSGICTE